MGTGAYYRTRIAKSRRLLRTATRRIDPRYIRSATAKILNRRYDLHAGADSILTHRPCTGRVIARPTPWVTAAPACPLSLPVV